MTNLYDFIFIILYSGQVNYGNLGELILPNLALLITKTTYESKYK